MISSGVMCSRRRQSEDNVKRRIYIYYDHYLSLDSLVKFLKTRLAACQVAEKDDGVSNAWTTVLGTI